jgi:hypothetical protein
MREEKFKSMEEKRTYAMEMEKEENAENKKGSEPQKKVIGDMG